MNTIVGFKFGTFKNELDILAVLNLGVEIFPGFIVKIEVNDNFIVRTAYHRKLKWSMSENALVTTTTYTFALYYI